MGTSRPAMKKCFTLVFAYRGIAVRNHDVGSFADMESAELVGDAPQIFGGVDGSPYPIQSDLNNFRQIQCSAQA